MMAAAPRRWHRLRRLTLLAIAIVIVLAATLQALARLAVPWLLSSPERVAHWLSDTVGQQVEIDQVSAVWIGRGPWLDASGVRVAAYNGQTAVELGRVRIGIDTYALLFRHRPLIESFVLVDAKVELERSADGRIALRGIQQRQAVSDLRALAEIGQFGVSDGTVRLQLGEQTLEIAGVELRIEHQAGSWRGALLKRSEGGYLRVVASADQEGLRELYLEADGFPLQSVNGLSRPFDLEAISGELNGRGWWHAVTGEGSGAFELQGGVFSAPAFVWSDGAGLAPHVRLPDGELGISIQRDGAQTTADLTTKSQDGISHVSVRLADRELTLVADRLSAATLADIAVLVPTLPERVRSMLYDARAAGDVSQLYAVIGPKWQVHASLSDLTASARLAGQQLNVRGLTGEIAADAEGAVLYAEDDQVEFSASPMLAGPITPRLEALVGLREMPELAYIRLHGSGYDIAADGALTRDSEGRVGLDLRARVPKADIQAAPAFWILHKMPPKTVAWLNRALSTGRVDDGRVVFRGAFSDWPFATQEGRFVASFLAEDAPLDYHEQWPSAHVDRADVSFLNNAMVVHALDAHIFGARINGSAAISNLKTPVMELRLAASGDGSDWLKFLEASPLRREHGDVLFGMALSGPSRVTTELSIPLKSTLGQPMVRGSALAEGLHFKDAKWHLDFADVRGRIDFTQRGFAADQLRMLIDDRPAELQIAVGEFVPEADRAVELSVVANTSLQTLFGHHAALTPVLDVTRGAASFHVDVSIGRAEGHSVIRYRSDLKGIAIGFPAPIGKAGDESRSFDLVVPLPTDRGVPLTLGLGDDLRLMARIANAQQPFAGELQFGERRAPALPARGLRVSGDAPDVDVAGWAGWILRSTGDDDPLLAELDVYAGSGVEKHRLQLARTEGIWTLGISGEQQQGQVRFDRQNGQALIDAEFERLYVPDPGGTVARKLPLSPSMVPTLHLRARSLRLGAASLGEVRLEAYPQDGGLRFAQVEAKSPSMELRAQGRWTQQGLTDTSEFSIQMTCEDLGRMLADLGYEGVIAGGQTLANFEANWSGAPHQFALERLRGTMDLSVGQGRFLDIDPGAGRIFGLLSLRELPRRITLDFRDFFESGMSFDRISGRFEFADGNAWTDGISVRGPAADLLIIGRTGLASRDYDQQVMVAPRLTGVLPVIGGLAAGPVGAAAGFLAQGIVAPGNNIESATQVHYSIGGSWEKPLVERLSPSREARPRSG